MKNFDFEMAKKGCPVVDLCGSDVDIIKWDATGDYPIVALLTEDNGEQIAVQCDTKGCRIEDGKQYLFMKTATKYLNIYTTTYEYVANELEARFFDSEEEASKDAEARAEKGIELVESRVVEYFDRNKK